MGAGRPATPLEDGRLETGGRLGTTVSAAFTLAGVGAGGA